MQRTRSSFSGLSLSTNKTIAVIIWLVGSWLTVQFLHQLGVPSPIDAGAGLATQAMLTFGERPLWRGRGYPVPALAFALIDTLLNAAGALPYLLNLGATDFWRLLSLALQSSGAPALTTILVFSALVGGAAAALPEYFWSLED